MKNKIIFNVQIKTKQKPIAYFSQAQTEDHYQLSSHLDNRKQTQSR